MDLYDWTPDRILHFLTGVAAAFIILGLPAYSFFRGRGVLRRTTVRELARRAFNAYGDEAEWKTHDGRIMPGWEQVGDVVQRRWTAGARRIALELGFKVRA